MKLRPHLHRIGNDIVAAYLVITPDGVTVIDAGLAGHWRELLAELTAAGKGLEDIKGVILTHGDSDHVGFAERLRRDHGVPVYVHPGDASRAMGGPKPTNAKQAMKLWPTIKFFSYALRMGGLRTTWLTDVLEAIPGQTLDLPGSPEIISMPGHSGGSIAVYVPAADAVFVGDALTTRHVLTGVRGPQPAPFTDNPKQAAKSLENLIATKASWVLPGHGVPWNKGVKAAVLAYRDSQRTSPSSTNDVG